MTTTRHILQSEVLAVFKQQIEDSLVLVSHMTKDDKVKAIVFWNDISERLQEVVNTTIILQTSEQEQPATEVVHQPERSSPRKRQNELEEAFELESKDEKTFWKQSGSPRKPAVASPNKAPEKTKTKSSGDEIPCSIDATEDQGKTYWKGQDDSTTTIRLGCSPAHNQSPAPPDPPPKSPQKNVKVEEKTAACSEEEDDDLEHQSALSDIPEEDEESNDISTDIAEEADQDPIQHQEEQSQPQQQHEEEEHIVSGETITMSVPGEHGGEQQILVVPDNMIDGVAHMDASQFLTAQIVSQDGETMVLGGEGGDNGGIVHLMITDSGTGDEEETPETEENLYLDHTETVRFDQHPPSVDESTRKVIKTMADGSAETVYECEYCQKTYITPAQLTSHRWTHTKPFSCERCHARFSTKGNLVVHRRRHTGEKPFLCNQCDARFSTKGNLKRHVKTHSGEKPWECEHCHGRFTEKKSLKVHMRKHTGERPYACTICGRRFAQTGILQTHMAMHLGQKTHLCDLCGKSFRQKAQLKLHMDRHGGIRKFVCDHCNTRFLTKGDLERHQRVHTGERPFSCELCGKTFTRAQSLNEHTNRHYGLKPYECKYCGNKYSEMSACYKHLKTHKKTDEPPEQQMIVHDYESLGEVVHPTVEDEADEFMEVVEGEEDVKMETATVAEADFVQEGQYIVLETTGEDGQPIQLTEANVGADGNIIIGQDIQQEDIEYVSVIGPDQ